MDIVRPEEIEPTLDEQAEAIAEKISGTIRHCRKKFDGKKITVGHSGIIPQHFRLRIEHIFHDHGWSSVDFDDHQNPDPGDPRGGSYTDITLYAECP